MNKNLGIFLLFVFICLATVLDNPQFITPFNVANLLRWSALYGIISIGVAFVIITGGIDLSVGSVIALVGCTLAMLLKRGHPAPLAVGEALLLSAVIGLIHGLLITKVRLQPFVVTLCGLLIYRGLARELTKDQTQGFGVGHEALKYLVRGKPVEIPVPFLRWISDGNWSRWAWDWDSGDYEKASDGGRVALDTIQWIAIPMPVFLLLAVAIVAGITLNYSVFGRHLLALGRNERAARYSGINTDRNIILAYVICSLLAGFGGILFALDVNSVAPASFGNFYELYAIAAAVLGGCSLRGGEGSILGVIIGAAVMRALYNAINLMEFLSTRLEFAIIGGVILGGAIVDILVKRYAEYRKARLSAK